MIETLLGSAAVAAVISVIGGMLTKMFVDTRFEAMKSDLNRKLEIVKSDLSVWATFRNDTLKEMWTAHREIVAAMTDVILKIQASGKAEGAVEDYRRLIHHHIDMIAPDRVDICQRFLESARRITDKEVPVNDANALKEIRREFYEKMAGFFRLGEVMPWMAS